MGMYCCCGVKKRDEWKCECDWEGWFLRYEMPYLKNNFPENIQIKDHPDIDGIYEVRTFDDGDFDEEESKFCILKKNWGQETNKIISHWEIEYSDEWMSYTGVYAWKQKFYPMESRNGMD